jgi:endoglucanase
MKRNATPVILFTVLCFFSILGKGQSSGNIIKLNQLGFYPNAEKIAIVTGTVSSPYFYVLSLPSHDTVYKARLEDTLSSPWSAPITRIARFSAIVKQGNYLVYIPGAGSSYPFTINRNVLHSAGIASIKGYFYQRLSMPLEAAYAGKWARPSGRPDNKVIIHPSAASEKRLAGTIISTPGGWFDAGDYNKYIVNSGITMGTLLSAYEDFPRYFDTLKTNIPESKDAVPDILNETIYNLRWMLTMQDPNDGGVYNKCTDSAFDGMVMPDVSKLPRYVVQKGTAATLDFAAVTAQAARILSKFNKQLPGLADSCRAAAQKAWQWALQYPGMQYDQNAINTRFDPNITTGGYGDRNFKDEWFWAACELLATTNNRQYADTVVSRWNDTLALPSWNNVRALGLYTLLRNKKAFSNISVISYNDAKARMVMFAQRLLREGGDKAYQTVMGRSRQDFVWGSNSVAMNQSIVLINAWFVTKENKYLNEALKNIDYVLGRNATGYCFITGFGTKSTLHPHHRPSVGDAINEPVPGLLAGGPNPGQQDRCEGYPSKMPAESYLDHDCSYASNEIAINWNAPLVYVANAMEALQRKLTILQQRR